MSADMAVDPGGELVDPGVDARQVWSATASPPADDTNQEPATPSWCLTGQRTPRITLTHRAQLIQNTDSTALPACRPSDRSSPCRRPALRTTPLHTACAARPGRSSSYTPSGSVRTPVLSGAQRAALCLQGGQT